MFFLELLHVGRRLRGGVLFEEAPEGNVAEVESVPVEIEHLRIELKNAVAVNACRRGNKFCEACINFGAIGAVGAGEKMPESEGIARARLVENCGEGGGGFGRLRRLVESVDSGDEGGGGVFEIGSARAEFGTRGAHGARRNEGIAAVEMEADPAERGANGAGAVGGNLESVGTAEIDGHSRRSVDNELARRSPDGGVNGADIELKAFVVWIDLKEADAGIGIDLNFAEIAIGERGERRRIRGESLADVEFGGRLIGGNRM